MKRPGPYATRHVRKQQPRPLSKLCSCPGHLTRQGCFAGKRRGSGLVSSSSPRPLGTPRPAETDAVPWAVSSASAGRGRGPARRRQIGLPSPRDSGCTNTGAVPAASPAHTAPQALVGRKPLRPRRPAAQHGVPDIAKPHGSSGIRVWHCQGGKGTGEGCVGKERPCPPKRQYVALRPPGTRECDLFRQKGDQVQMRSCAGAGPHPPTGVFVRGRNLDTDGGRVKTGQRSERRAHQPGKRRESLATARSREQVPHPPPEATSPDLGPPASRTGRQRLLVVLSPLPPLAGTYYRTHRTPTAGAKAAAPTAAKKGRIPIFLDPSHPHAVAYM